MMDEGHKKTRFVAKIFPLFFFLPFNNAWLICLREENKLNNELYGKIEMMKFHDVRKYAFIAMNFIQGSSDAKSLFITSRWNSFPYILACFEWLKGNWLFLKSASLFIPIKLKVTGIYTWFALIFLRWRCQEAALELRVD